MNPEEKFTKNFENLSKLLIKEETILESVKDQFSKKLVVSSIKEKKGNNLFVIFFKFGAIQTTLEGDVSFNDLAEELARRLAEKGFVVIAGDYVYEKKGREIEMESTTLDTIKRAGENKEDSNFRLCEILAAVTNYAVFLLANEDSAAVFESRMFHKEEFEKNKGSIAVAFTDKDIKDSCKCLKEKEISPKVKYHICESTSWRKCFQLKDNCYFTQELNLSGTPLELHINKLYASLVLVNKHKSLSEIIFMVMSI